LIVNFFSHKSEFLYLKEQFELSEKEKQILKELFHKTIPLNLITDVNYDKFLKKRVIKRNYLTS
jgi:hypothetical protein